MIEQEFAVSVEIAARSDACFDGFDFDGLSRAAKRRYLDRAEFTISNAVEVNLGVDRDVILQRLNDRLKERGNKG